MSDSMLSRRFSELLGVMLFGLAAGRWLLAHRRGHVRYAESHADQLLFPLQAAGALRRLDTVGEEAGVAPRLGGVGGDGVEEGRGAHPFRHERVADARRLLAVRAAVVHLEIVKQQLPGGVAETRAHREVEAGDHVGAPS